jgi:hypothetical protein
MPRQAKMRKMYDIRGKLTVMITTMSSLKPEIMSRILDGALSPSISKSSRSLSTTRRHLEQL